MVLEYIKQNDKEHIQGDPEKTAQNLMRYNFSTAGHRVSRFPAK